MWDETTYPFPNLNGATLFWACDYWTMFIRAACKKFIRHYQQLHFAERIWFHDDAIKTIILTTSATINTHCNHRRHLKTLSKNNISWVCFLWIKRGPFIIQHFVWKPILVTIYVWLFHIKTPWYTKHHNRVNIHRGYAVFTSAVLVCHLWTVTMLGIHWRWTLLLQAASVVRQQGRWYCMLSYSITICCHGATYLAIWWPVFNPFAFIGDKCCSRRWVELWKPITFYSTSKELIL